MELEQSTVIIVIITLVCVAFLFGIWAVVQQTVSAETVKRSCQLSIEKKLFIDEATTKVLNPYQIECPRRIISVEDRNAQVLNSEYLTALSKSTQYTYYSKTDEGVRSQTIREEDYEQSLTEAIAYEMAECWDTFHRGEQDPLSGATWAAIPANTCFICAEVHVQDGPTVEIPIGEELAESQHHLLDAQARRYATYDDFLYGASSQAQPQICRNEGYVGSQSLTVGPQDSVAIVYYKHGTVTANAGNSCQAVAVTQIRDIPEECMTII